MEYFLYLSCNIMKHYQKVQNSGNISKLYFPLQIQHGTDSIL